MKQTVLIFALAFALFTLAQCSQRVYRGHCKGLSKQMMMPKHKSPVRYR